MIACKECSTLNSLDSAFCKSCGKPLPAEEALDARGELEKRLDEGFALFHQGRTDEAAHISEKALSSDPSNIRGLSLRAMVLERRGMLLEALEAYEAIVARDPNAALERMKVQTLRDAVQQQHLTPPPLDTRLRALIAVGAAVLVISLGALAAVLSSRSQVQTVAKADPLSQVTMDTFSPSPAATSTATQGTKAEAAEAKPEQPDSESGQPETPQSKLDQTVPANALLPKPTASEGEIKPINPITGAEIQPVNTNQASPPVVKPDPQPKTDPEPSEVNARKPEPSSGPPPLVDIQLSDPSQSPSNEGALDNNGVEALVRTARGQYQVGNYQAAATTYERALRAGADAAMVNQRLGQCYDKLGRTSDATAAYNRAITAIQNAINQGRGNKQLLMAALESSRQALQNLQGG